MVPPLPTTGVAGLVSASCPCRADLRSSRKVISRSMRWTSALTRSLLTWLDRLRSGVRPWLRALNADSFCSLSEMCSVTRASSSSRNSVVSAAFCCRFLTFSFRYSVVSSLAIFCALAATSLSYDRLKAIVDFTGEPLRRSVTSALIGVSLMSRRMRSRMSSLVSFWRALP